MENLRSIYSSHSDREDALDAPEIHRVFECMGDGVLVCDADGELLVANRVARSILGNIIVERERITAWDIQDKIFLRDGRTAVEPHLLPLQRAIRGDCSDHLEFVVRGVDANDEDGRLISCTARPVLNENRLVGGVVVFRDITERDIEQQRLRELARDNENQMKEVNLILDCLSGGVVTVNTNFVVTRMNRAALNIMGANLTGLSLHGWSDAKQLWHIDRTTPVSFDELPLVRAVRGEATSGLDFWFTQHGDNDGMVIGMSGRPLENNGEIVGGLVTFQDITDKIAAARERQHMQLRLQEMQKLESVGRLSAGIAHEINTPIQYVCNNVSFLRDAAAQLVPILRRTTALLTQLQAAGGTDDELESLLESLQSDDLEFLLEEVTPAIEQSLEGAHRVANIVQAMKEFSHPGNGYQSVDINRAIESSTTVARNEWKHDAELELELDPTLPNIVCNPGEFNQVILNMVINAAHAVAARVAAQGGEPGRIRISTAAEPGGARVVIEDNGCGIPALDRDKIFEPFFTTKEIGKGTGQGLAICYDVVINKHGGRIEIDSEPGEGTTFTLHLPNQTVEQSD